MSVTMSSVFSFGSDMGVSYINICSNLYIHWVIFAFEIRETGNEWDIDISVT